MNSFEENMGKLKELSEKIKDREIGLDEAVKCYEEGMEYYKKCDEILQSARQKIKVFEGDV